MGDPIVTKISVQDIQYKIKGTLYDERGYNTDGGMTQSALSSLFDNIDLTLSDIRTKSDGLSLTTEDGFYIIDASGDIALKVDSNGVFDVSAIGTNLQEIIGNKAIQTVDSSIIEINNTIDSLGTTIDNVEGEINELSENAPRVIDDYGVYFTDANGNIMWFIKTYKCLEDGLYFIDEHGNVGLQYVDGEWSFSNLTNADGSGGGSSIDSSTMDHSLIMRTNRAIKELNSVKNQIDHSIPSLLTLTNGETQSTFSTTVQNTSAKEKAIVRLRLHYGSSKYTPDDNDIFFNGTCKTDFSDVRFFDSNGNMLKAAFGEPFHLGVYRDTNLHGTTHGRYTKVTSNGYLIKTNNQGIVITKDNGQTWTPIGPNGSGYKNYSEYPSDVYGFRGMIPVFVDSNNNLFGYSGGKLYKIEHGANYDYTNEVEVCDFSWVYTDPSTGDTNTVYPEITPAGMTEDINGNLYFGTYADTKYYHIDIFVSTNQGNSGTWVKKYHKSETDLDATGNRQKDFQHVHHIHADKYSTKVYVGIDGGFPAQGPTLIYTDDAGETWNDITTRLKEHRGHDQYPAYFGQTYKLGGGESYTLGGNSIIRGNADDTEFEDVWKGWGGVRFISDFGDDSLLIVGIQRNSHFEENQILLSYDQGKTWKNLMRADTPKKVTSGDGFRKAIYCGTLAGDTAPCVILNQGHFTEAFRVYKETNDYYREVEVEVDDVPSSASEITITAKTGYVMPYPYTTVRGLEVYGLVYEIPFNEGCGTMVQDSLGNIVSVDGTISWETKEEPVRYGEYSSEEDKPFAFSSAAKVNGTLDFGKIDKLNFSNGYTITFWWNEKNRFCHYTEEERYDHGYLSNPAILRILSAGNYDLVRTKEALVGIIPRGATTRDVFNSHSAGMQALPCSDNYCFICIVVSDTRIYLYLNGSLSGGSTVGSWVGFNDMNLSENNLVIGSADTETPGYISDFKIYNRQLSDNEIRDIYKGFNYEPRPENP